MISSINCKRRNCVFYQGFYCAKTGEQIDKDNNASCPEEHIHYWDDDFD